MSRNNHGYVYLLKIDVDLVKVGYTFRAFNRRYNEYPMVDILGLAYVYRPVAVEAILRTEFAIKFKRAKVSEYFECNPMIAALEFVSILGKHTPLPTLPEPPKKVCVPSAPSSAPSSIKLSATSSSSPAQKSWAELDEEPLDNLAKELGIQEKKKRKRNKKKKTTSTTESSSSAEPAAVKQTAVKQTAHGKKISSRVIEKVSVPIVEKVVETIVEEPSVKPTGMNILNIDSFDILFESFSGSITTAEDNSQVPPLIEGILLNFD